MKEQPSITPQNCLFILVAPAAPHQVCSECWGGEYKKTPDAALFSWNQQVESPTL